MPDYMNPYGGPGMPPPDPWQFGPDGYYDPMMYPGPYPPYDMQGVPGGFPPPGGGYDAWPPYPMDPMFDRMNGMPGPDPYGMPGPDPYGMPAPDPYGMGMPGSYGMPPYPDMPPEMGGFEVPPQHQDPYLTPEVGMPEVQTAAQNTNLDASEPYLGAPNVASTAYNGEPVDSPGVSEPIIDVTGQAGNAALDQSGVQGLPADVPSTSQVPVQQIVQDSPQQIQPTNNQGQQGVKNVQQAATESQIQNVANALNQPNVVVSKEELQLQAALQQVGQQAAAAQAAAQVAQQAAQQAVQQPGLAAQIVQQPVAGAADPSGNVAVAANIPTTTNAAVPNVATATNTPAQQVVQQPVAQQPAVQQATEAVQVAQDQAQPVTTVLNPQGASAQVTPIAGVEQTQEATSSKGKKSKRSRKSAKKQSNAQQGSQGKKRSNVLALILGIFSIIFALVPPIGLILAIISLALSRRFIANGGRRSGADAARVFATVGLWFSIIVIATLVLFVGYALGVNGATFFSFDPIQYFNSSFLGNYFTIPVG